MATLSDPPQALALHARREDAELRRRTKQLELENKIPTPAGGDLAGRWLSRFLTSHLAAERDVPVQTIASYRDAIRLQRRSPATRMELGPPEGYGS